jgi:hypothetical protein
MTIVAGDDAQIANLTAGLDLTVTAAGNLNAGPLKAGGNLLVTAGGDLFLTQAASAASMTIVAGDDAQIANLTAGSDLAVITTEDLTASQLVSSNGNLTLHAGQSLSLKHATGKKAADLRADLGTAQVIDLVTGGDLSVASAGSLNADQMTSGAKLAVKSGGDLSLNHAASAGSMTILAGDDAQIANLTAASDLNVTTGGNLTADQMTSGAKLAMKSGGNLVLGTASSADAAQITANGAGISSLTAGGDLTITAAAGLNAVQIASTHGKITVTAGDTLTLGRATSAGTMQFTAGGAAIIGQLQSAFAGDRAISLSADTISGNGTSLANLLAPAGAKAYLKAQRGIGSASLYLTVSVPALQAATASGSIYIHALSDLILDDINVAANLGLLADHNLTFGNILAGQSVSLTAANALIGSSLKAGGLAALTAGAGSIQLAHLLASDLVLVSAGTLVLNDVTAAGHIAMTAPSLAAKIAQLNGNGPLQVSITGLNGGPAASGNLSIDAPNGVIFSNYAVTDGTVLTTASLVNFQQAFVPGQLLLVTPATSLYMNNQSLRPVADVTEQFYVPSKAFFLEQQGKNTKTNAFALDFGDGYVVTTVDGQGNSLQGVSLVRDAPLPLNSTTWATVYASQQASGSIDQIYAISVQQGIPVLALIQQWVSGVENGAAVNTNSQ